MLVFIVGFADADPVTVPTLPAGSTAAADLALIRMSYDQMNTDFLGSDFGGLGSILSTDYTQVDPKGNVLRKDGTIKKLKGERSEMKEMNMQCSITSVVPDPAGVTVGFQMHVAGIGEKRILFFKFDGTFTYDLVAQDYWIAVPGGWLLQSRKENIDSTISHTD